MFIILTTMQHCLVSLRGGAELLEHIFGDLRNRADLALAWVYHEYTLYQGYTLPGAEKPSIAGYDRCLCRLLAGLLDRPDQKEGYGDGWRGLSLGLRLGFGLGLA